MLKNFIIDFTKKENIIEKHKVLNEIKLITQDENSLIFKVKDKKVNVFDNKERDSLYHMLIKLFETESNDNFISLYPVDFKFSDGDIREEELEELNPKKRFYYISIIFKKFIDEVGVEFPEEYYFLSKHTFYKLNIKNKE